MTCKSKFNCLKVSSIGILLLLLQPGFAQKNAKEYSTASFKELNDVLNSQQKALGKDMVTLVWTDTLVYKKETGDANVRTQAAIGDASSWLTAALVMQFIDEGKLSMDTKVSQYIPAFAKYGKNYITIGTCLTHMTGVQSDPGKIARVFEKKKFASLEDEVNEYASKEIQTNPGTEFRYSPIGISIAGRVLEIISKKKFDMLIQQRLLRPLGMRNTTFSTMDASAINPTNGARSTAEDYMKFLVMLLNKGVYKDQHVLSEAAVKQLEEVHITADKIKYAPKEAQGDAYALGSWIVEAKQNGEPVTISGLGIGSIVPMLDMCRRYAVVFFPNNTQEDQTINTYLNIKKQIDDMMPAPRKQGCD